MYCKWYSAILLLNQHLLRKYIHLTLTFKRGIHPNEQKQHTRTVPVEVLLPAAGSEIVIPLSQNVGAVCEPLVEKGSRVLVGEKIGDSGAYISAPVHSTVSGIVTAIRPYMTVNGDMVNSVIIENHGIMEEHGSMRPRDGYASLTRGELLGVIREAGVVGLGGAGFPTHVKLSPPPDKKIDTYIVNGCECEPYLTTDNRVMIEETGRLITGLKIALKLLPGAKGVIAVEDNKPMAIKTLKEHSAGVEGVQIAVVQSKYPQGSEKQLVYSITGRETPSGGLPMDAGCIVNNVDTIIAIHRAVIRGRPLMRKIITLTGNAINHPGNYKARIGTKLGDLVDLAGGFRYSPTKIVAGGPLMGKAIFDINVPVIKTTAGVLFLSREEAYIPPERNCIRCGQCVDNCPMGLVPTELNTDVLNEDGASFIEHNGLECIECGSCSYVCPAKRRIAQAIRTIRRAELAKR